MGVNMESILSPLRDELLVLIFIARSNNRMAAAEGDIILRYASERAKDKRLYFDGEVGDHILKWMKGQRPTADQLPGMLGRVKKAGLNGIQALLEVTTILAELDPTRKPGVMHQLGQLQTLIKAHM